MTAARPLELVHNVRPKPLDVGWSCGSCGLSEFTWSRRDRRPDWPVRPCVHCADHFEARP